MLAVCLIPGILFSTAAYAQPGSGTAAILPATDVAAGSSGTWTVTYQAATNFSTGVVRLTIPAGWTTPQISLSSSAGFVTATSQGALNITPISIAGNNITVNVDTLTAGETVTIVYGAPAGPADAQTLTQSGVEFTVGSNPLGSSPSDLTAGSPTLNVVAAPVSKLVFTTAAQTVKAGGESQVMRVMAFDEFDNPSPVVSAQDVSLSSTSGSGTFSHLPAGSWSATTSVTISAGEDTVSFYYRDTFPGAYNITASADGQSWTDAQQTVTVDPGDAASLVISPADTTITAGEFGRYILRTIDIIGNPSAPAADQTITLIAGGGSFYDKDDHGTTLTELVIPSGSSAAEFDFRHTIKNTGAGYFLVFLDNDGVAPLLQSDNTIVYIDNAAADTSASSIETDAATATADGVAEMAVTVTVRDEFGNPVPGVAVVLSMTGTGNVITQPGAVTDASGVASGSVRSTVAEAKNIRATADGTYLEDIILVTFTAGPLDLAVSTIGAVPLTVPANGTDITTVTVTARDAQGNAVPGAAVVLAATGSGNTITQPAVVTDALGTATGTISSTVAGLKTVSATINGSALTPTVDVDFITGTFSLTESEISGDKSLVTADGSDELTVTVTVRDGEGNPVAGAAVTLEATGTGNTITDPGPVTGVDGIATGTISSTVAEQKVVRALIEGSQMVDTLVVDWEHGPLDLAVSTIGAVPLTVPANGTDITTVTVTARDAQGNAVPGAAVVLAATGSGNTITQPAVVTDALGTATGTISSTVAGLKTVSATINGSALTPTVDVDFITGTFSLTESEISGDKSLVTADGSDELTVTVTVRDGEGNPVAGAAVTLEATGTGNTITDPGPVTGVDGIATGTISSTVAEQKVVRALIEGSQMVDTLVVDWEHGPLDLAVSTIGAVPLTVPANGTDITTVTVTARDAQGNAVPGAAVVLAATGSGNTITQPAVVTDALGTATGTISSTVAGLKTVSATINGSALTPTVDVDFITGTFSLTESEISGDKSLVTADGSDELTVTVTVRDGEGNPVAGAAVTLEATGTGNTITDPGPVTGVDGIATGTISSTVAEQKVVRALIEGSQMVDTLVVDWEHGPLDLAVSTIGAVPLTVPANGTDITTVTVTARDAQGNAVPGAAVVLAATGSGNTITQPAVVTDALGTATGTISSTVAGLKTVSATINGSALTPTVDVDFITGTFSLTESEISGDKSLVTADGSDELTVTVTVRDGEGNPVAGAAVTLEATGTGNTITDPGPVTGVDGIATGTISSTVAEQKVVRALIEGSQMVDTLVVDWEHGPLDLAVSTIGAVPLTVPANGTDITTVTVTARDAQGNAVPGAAVVLAATGSGNTITQPAVVTDALGTATGTISSTVAGLKTVSATINGSALTPTVDVDFITGTFSLTESEISGDKSLVTADGSDELTVTVTVRDGEGNPVAGAAVTLEATGTGNTITDPGPVTGVDGIATGTISSTVAEQKVVRALIEGSQMVDTLVVDWEHGPLDLAVSTIGAVPLTVPANGTDITTVTVTARDAQGNAVPGAAVVLAATGSGNTITQPAVVTDALGTATGTISSTVAGLKTVSATINGSALTPTVDVDFITGTFSLTESEISGDKSLVTADGSDELTVTVTVRDGEGNPVAGAAVTLEATGTGNTITDPGPVTGVDGIATGTISSTVAEQKVVRALIEGSQMVDTLVVDWEHGPLDLAVSTIGAVPLTVPANGTDITTVTVTARDAQGNAVPGAAVVLAATGSGNTITQPAVVTDALGTATGTISSTVAGLKTVSATINGSALTPTVDVDFLTGSFDIALSFMDGDKNEVTADDVDALGVTVMVRDQYDNPVVGAAVTLEATGTANTIVQPVGGTDIDGKADGTISSTFAERKVIRARIGTVQITDTLVVDWVPGPVDLDRSQIFSDVDTVTADGSDNCRITVVVRDANDNPIGGASVNLQADDTGGNNTYFQPVDDSNEFGIAVGWISSTYAEIKTVSATINGFTMSGTRDVAFVAGEPDRFVITHDGSGTAGAPEEISIEIFDANDNTVDWFDDIIRVYTDSPEITDMIDWALGPGASGSISESGDTVSYDFSVADNGRVVLGFRDEKAETVYFTARYGSVIDQSVLSMTIAPAQADSIFIIAGNGQRAVVDQAVAQPLTVGVEDAFGNRVPSHAVRFHVTAGAGMIDVDTSSPPDDQEWTVTDGAGVAVCDSWILGTVSGEGSDEASASIPFGSTDEVFFTATTDHDELASVVLAPAVAGVTVNSNLIVTATMRDQFNNLVVGENLTIFIKDAADGTLSEDTGNANATVPLGPGIRSGSSDSTGTVTVQYNSPAAAGLSDIVDASHAVLTADQIADAVYTSVASGATKLIVTDITGQPSQAGTVFSFRVRAVDSNDNLDPTNTSHIVLVPEAGGGLIFSSDIGLVPAITEIDLINGEYLLYAMGTATGDWNIDVIDSPSSLTDAAFTASITANDNVHHYAITAPAVATAGIDFPVSLEARDEWNNLVTTANYDIDLRAVQPVDTAAAAGAALNITAGAISNGRFSEDNLRYDLAEPIRVEIRDDSTSVVGVSGVVDIGHAPAWQIVEVSGDTTGVAAGSLVLLSMRVLDSFGNPVGGETVSFSILEGGGGLGALQGVTGVDGMTSVSYTTGVIAGTNRVRAAILDGNPEGLETREFVIETVPQGAIAYVLLDITGDTFEAGEEFTVHVTAYDLNNNPITTDNSTRLIPVAQTLSVVFNPDTLQLSSGEASFTATDTVMGTNRIFIEELSGVTRGGSSDLTITAGPAYELVKVSGDTTGVISGDTTEVLVRVADMYGNPVQNETVRFLITSNLGGSPSLIDETGAPGDGLVLSAANGTAACRLVTDTNYGTNNVLTTILDGTPERETATFDVETTAGTIQRYTLVPVGTIHTAGESFDVEITGYDLNDNVAEGDFTTVVDLGSDGTAVWAENPVTLNNGRYTVSVSENAAGPLVLHAETQGGGALSNSETIMIVPELPSGDIWIASINPDTITADGMSQSAIETEPVFDIYGNVVPERTLVTVSTTGGSVASEDLDLTEPGVQRETAQNGVVSVFVRSGITPGDYDVDFASVEGSATGDTVLTFAPPPAVAYADSIYPIYAVPGSDLHFSVRMTNTSPTRVLLGAASKISFSDGIGHEFEAELGSSLSLNRLETADLIFTETTMHPMFEPGTYSPRISLIGTDEYGSAYTAGFDAGANSVSVSSIEISSILPLKTVVSRGDTAIVNVNITNTGGAVVRIQEIDLLFASGSYLALPDSTFPELPDTLPAGLSRTYALKTIVLPNCPLGVDTIDAQVTARVNGYEVTDLTADHNVATWTVQSSALISYEAGTLAPMVVSSGQAHSFTLDLLNSGEAAVILDAGLTTLSFNDGTETYAVALASEGALPGGAVSDLIFPETSIPAGMSAGAWEVTVVLSGTENGGEFDTSFVLSDPVTVVSPAAVSYNTSSLSPSTVSKNSSVAFEVGINNTGGADVFLDPAATTFELDDGATTYIAYLDGARNNLLAPGENTIWFEAVTIPPGFITNSYTPVIELSGTENGLPFAAQPPVSDAVSVQDASQLAINSTEILLTDLFTADQTGFRIAQIRVANNGEAEVRLDSLDVRFYIGGSEVTGEYVLSPLPDVAGIQVPGGADTLVRMMFEDGAGPATTGTVTVESSLWGTDLNSMGELEVTTEYGGKGSFTVQTPSVLAVDHVIASVTEATAGQDRDWVVDVIVRNDGESDLDLNLAATALTFSTSGDFTVIPPAELAGGGITLEGESSDTLSFIVDITGSVSGNCSVNMTANGTEINSARNLGPVSADPADAASVDIQGEALLQVVSVTALQDPVTVGQSNEWSIDMVVINGGGSSVTLDLDSFDSTFVAVDGGIGFAFTRPTEILEGGLSLEAGETGTLRFIVNTTGSVPAGATALSGSIIGTEDNSGSRVYDGITGPVGINSMLFEERPVPQYTLDSLTPTVASTGSDIGIQLGIFSDDPDHATIILDRDRTVVWFGDADGDTFRTDLSAVSPVTLAGGSDTTLTFNSAPVSVDLERIAYIVGIHLEGTENGNPFTADITTSPDTIEIEEASQLAISSIVVPQSVTAIEQPDWEVRMIIRNTGEASVRLVLDSDLTDISFTMAGVGDRTYEYEPIVRPMELSGLGGVVLPGGQTDTLVFGITTTGSTTGTALVNGIVTAVDINSSEILTDDTYTGGGSYMAIQSPAAPVVLETIASQDSVTSGQTTPWNVTVLVRNDGEAAMTLQPGITSIYASPYTLTVPVPPASFVEGGTVLAAGEEGHLAFGITPTPSVPAGDDLTINTIAIFSEDNSGISRMFDTGAEGSGYGSVRVQAPADIHIVALTGNAPRQPFVNMDQSFPLAVEIINSGEAAAELVSTDLTGDGTSIILNSPVTFGTIAGGETLIDTFRVTAADVAGSEDFTSSIISATDVNSGQDDLVTVSSGDDTTETMTIQEPAGLAVTSVQTSQDELNAGQTADWTIRLNLTNNGDAPTTIDVPSPDDMEFLDSGSGFPLSGYLVVPPVDFGSGTPGWTLDGGETDSLIYIVSTTGTDTGIVDINADVSWVDENDPGAGASISSGNATVHVHEPSGLRIISVTSNAPNNTLIPNTSIVNEGQIFNVTVTVENTGGDDLRDIVMSITSNGPASITETVSTPDLPNETSGDFVYEVYSPAAGVEILTAEITEAYSVNTGEPVSPIQAVESAENLQVQVPAALVTSTYVLSPAGAVDDTVSTDQQFVFAAMVENTGQAEIDATGQITLSLPAGFTRVNPGTESLTMSFAAGQQITWTLQAPAAASVSPEPVTVSITSTPNDINIASASFVQKDADTVSVMTEDAAVIAGCLAVVSDPSGARDLVLSSNQDFIVTFTAIPSGNSGSNTATITLPAGFTTAGNQTIQLGTGDGTEKTAEWAVTAPGFISTANGISVSTAGTDDNSGISFSGCTHEIYVDIVSRAVLNLTAMISGPPEAVDGNLSVGLPFTIQADVTNAPSAAGIDTTGARLEIVLPDGGSYTLAAGETYRKTFFPGTPVNWNMTAPDAAEPPRIITVQFASPPATDENTNEPVAYLTSEIPIGVTTEAGTITMQNVSNLDTIPPVIVPRGASDVPVLRVVFKNNSAYTAGLDTLFVSVEDGNGNLRSDPSRYVSAISLSAGLDNWSEPVGSVNPVPVIVDHNFTLLAGASDTALVSIDVSTAAPDGELRINLAESRDVVFSIGDGGSPIGVVRDANGEDIAGFFYNTSLSVMSANFEEYVHNYPNPFMAGSEVTKIAYFLTEDTAVSIKIYDYTGVLVWTKDIPAGGPGGSGEPGGTWWEADWDGRNGRGEVVRNGVYICKVMAGGDSAMFKIAVAK